jgi:hypothetical protein
MSASTSFISTSVSAWLYLGFVEVVLGTRVVAFESGEFSTVDDEEVVEAAVASVGTGILIDSGGASEMGSTCCWGLLGDGANESDRLSF